MYGHVPGIYSEAETLLGMDQYPIGRLRPLIWEAIQWKCDRMSVYACEGGSVNILDVGESWGSHLDEVVLCDPSIPVLLEYSQCSLVVLHLAECVLINDHIIVCIDEDAWCYPRLA